MVCRGPTGTLPPITKLDYSPQLMYIGLVSLVVPSERKYETPIQFSFSATYVAMMWDGLASYNDTAKPVLQAAAVPRQPPAARTNTNINTVICYITLHAAEALLPAAIPAIRQLLVTLGLNPDDTSTDTGTPVGVANTVAKAWAAYAAGDGMNRGGAVGHKFNRRNFSDYTAYVPVNDAYTLRSPTKWQPLLETDDIG